ncbi:AAC(3) family N-acetyltransferase [Arsenophonus sp. PmNCSU2021_1]|uniref:AAC(3) family N-acetyltransferase n=1 Tax=Arsenophonus sp. PmNCSU2021_1 TaxID=3118989 RepID=UPI002FF3850E
MLTKNVIIRQLYSLGIGKNDVVLIRADLGKVGRIEGGAFGFVDALLDVVGEGGTIISLAFTSWGSFIKKPKIEDAFDISKKSYAGALPNAMLRHPNALRSKHPMCSYVAIGKYASYFTADHNENSPAYEPIRKLIDLDGKCVLIGCVKNSPGFTTAHLAEADLGLLKLNIFPSLNRVYYKSIDGQYKIFKRKDFGLCSDSYYKFYSHYVKEGILHAGRIGKAYSIIVPAKESYRIEKKILELNSKFSICDSRDCINCNIRRWDQLHKIPLFIIRKIIKKLFIKFNF